MVVWYGCTNTHNKSSSKDKEQGLNDGGESTVSNCDQFAHRHAHRVWGVRGRIRKTSPVIILTTKMQTQ
jgi:hypothetical protein